MTGFLLVAAGAAFGAPARWLVDRAVRGRWRGPMPWGTLTVNLAGSFVLGLVLAAAGTSPWGPQLVLLLGTGFCGAFTTFSTFSFEMVRLVELGRLRHAGGYLCLSVVAGCLLAVLGWRLGSLLWD